MSFKTEELAKKRADQVKAMLPRKGQGWTIRVWENLGWHWSLYNGPMSLYESNVLRQFWCGISREMHYPEKGDYPIGMAPEYSCDDIFKTPLAAIKAQIKQFEEYKTKQVKSLIELSDYLNDCVLTKP